MKKLIAFLTVAAICLCVTTSVFAQKNKGVAEVNLNVTIDDGVNQNGTYGLGSDSSGTYYHGSNLVEAKFLSSGVLSFKSGDRFVNVYYNPFEITGDPLVPNAYQNVQFLTFVNTPPFQNMSPGETRCQGLAINIFIPNYTRTIGYQAGQGYLKQTGYVRVTRLTNENGKGKWIVDSNSTTNHLDPLAPHPPCFAPDNNVYDNIATIADRKTSGKPAADIIYGRYNMPFKLTLKQQ